MSDPESELGLLTHLDLGNGHVLSLTDCDSCPQRIVVEPGQLLAYVGQDPLDQQPLVATLRERTLDTGERFAIVQQLMQADDVSVTELVTHLQDSNRAQRQRRQEGRSD